jgi:hypothetical protein
MLLVLAMDVRRQGQKPALLSLWKEVLDHLSEVEQWRFPDRPAYKERLGFG